MPNFITDDLKKPLLPFSESGYDFLWEIHSKNDSLIMVRNSDTSFFIAVRPKDGLYLIKGEKISRPSQVLHLQKALEIYAKKAASNILFSNIKSACNRKERENPVVKNIDFFARGNFTNDDKIYLEVGFGSGRHLLYQAKNNPDKLIIGIEIHKPSLEQVAKQCEISGLKNVVLIDYDSRILMEFLPSNCVEKIFVHFPVPWDKKPHRRVISEYFVSEVLRVLKIGGTLEVRTDSELYFQYTLEVFTAKSDADIRILKNFDLEISSKYEDRWKKLNKNIYDIILTNRKEDEKLEQPKALKFNFNPNINKIIKDFSPKIFAGDGFFVHFENLYAKDKEIALIKISFGANERAERSFVVISENVVSYFPNNIYDTKANKAAHQIITKWLYE